MFNIRGPSKQHFQNSLLHPLSYAEGSHTFNHADNLFEKIVLILYPCGYSHQLFHDSIFKTVIYIYDDMIRTAICNLLLETRTRKVRSNEYGWYCSDLATQYCSLWYCRTLGPSSCFLGTFIQHFQCLFYGPLS